MYLSGDLYIYGGFPKLGVPFLGVPIIRTTVFGGLYYWGPPVLGNYHIYVYVYDTHRHGLNIFHKIYQLR